MLKVWIQLLAGLLNIIDPSILLVIIGEVYDGPGKQFISLLPLVGYAGLVPQVVGLWHQVAKQLTDWENHRKSIKTCLYISRR